MKNNINKYGLRRNIPKLVKDQIRREAFYGCVICGCVLVDYEHIEPEFHDAKEHDPTRMTLLCIGCHGKVTRRLISKKRVWEAKADPKAGQNGYVHDLLYVDTAKMELNIGNSVATGTSVILTIRGKPMLWFDQSTDLNEPSKLCGIFNDDQGQTVALVNRNEFRAIVGSYDIKSESTELSILQDRRPLLCIDRSGDQAITIKALRSTYLNISVEVAKDGSIFIRDGQSSFTLSSVKIQDCGSAFSLGAHVKFRRYKPIAVALYLHRFASKCHPARCAFGRHVGWFMEDEVIDRNYCNVGYVKGGRVYTLADEFVGNASGEYITFPNDSYEDGEPIYLTSRNHSFRMLSGVNQFDLSFRLFE